MPIEHLLAKLEQQADRPRRKIRPAWVTAIIEEVAELFEPLSGVGRVGFDCRLTEDRWEISLYLGACELVGGEHDGRTKPLDFQFDMQELHGRFNLVESWDWTAYPCRESAPVADDEKVSLITIEGYWADNPIRLKVFETPPVQIGPGLREYPNGRREQV